MRALWNASPGVRLVAADDERSIASFLARSPGMSFVCEDAGDLIGTAMCGHDGRRGSRGWKCREDITLYSKDV